MKRFRNRREAGQRLAAELGVYRNRPEVIVLALPRGGVPVAYEVAQALNAPLDVFIVRKLGLIGHEELAVGAIASGGVRVLNPEIVAYWEVSVEELDAITRREESELIRREQEYREGQPFPDLRNRTVILVDDGLATGATMRAAVQAVKLQYPQQVIVAVPAAAPETCESFRSLVDDIICAITPEPFQAVGLWYEDFSQTTDAEVKDLLRRASRG